MGMMALPRDLFMPLGKFMQAHSIAHLGKSFYLQTSWGQRALFNVVKHMIDPATVAKFTLTAEIAPQELKDLFHPSQLEKRFGGAAETPTVCWPPIMGPEFLIDGDDSHLNKMCPKEYIDVIVRNPEILKHPDFVNEDESARDFITKRSNEKVEEESINKEESEDEKNE